MPSLVARTTFSIYTESYPPISSRQISIHANMQNRKEPTDQAQIPAMRIIVGLLKRLHRFESSMCRKHALYPLQMSIAPSLPLSLDNAINNSGFDPTSKPKPNCTNWSRTWHSGLHLIGNTPSKCRCHPSPKTVDQISPNYAVKTITKLCSQNTPTLDHTRTTLFKQGYNNINVKKEQPGSQIWSWQMKSSPAAHASDGAAYPGSAKSQAAAIAVPLKSL